MNLPTTLRMKALNAKGIAHFVAPLVIVLLVGVIGTYMLVASHAATRTVDNGVKPVTKPKNGVLVVYSEEGRYDSVKIVLTGADAKTHKCGGLFNTSVASVTKKLPTTKQADGKLAPLSIKCSAIGGYGNYHVYFGKNKKFTGQNTTIDVDEGFCTLVHSDAAKTRKIAADAAGNCPGSEAEPDAATKIDVVMKTLPKLSGDKKSILGFVQVSSATEDLTMLQCTGQVLVGYTSTTTGLKVNASYSLRYVKPKTGNSYCVAQIYKLEKPLAAGEYNVNGYLGGTAYFNEAMNTARITIPKTQ